MSAPEIEELSGSIVLSSGERIGVRVVLIIPKALSKDAACELESTRVALHDLTPLGKRKRG